jgi:hypothetical protein
MDNRITTKENKKGIALIHAILDRDTEKAIDLLNKNSQCPYQYLSYFFYHQFKAKNPPSGEDMDFFSGGMSPLDAAVITNNHLVLFHIISTQRPTLPILYNFLCKATAISCNSSKTTLHDNKCHSTIYLLNTWNAHKNKKPTYVTQNKMPDNIRTLFDIHLTHALEYCQLEYDRWTPVPPSPLSLYQAVITCLLKTAKENLNSEEFIQFTHTHTQMLLGVKDSIISPYEALMATGKNIHFFDDISPEKKEDRNSFLSSLFKIFLHYIPFDSHAELFGKYQDIPTVAEWAKYYENRCTWPDYKRLLYDIECCDL